MSKEANSHLPETNLVDDLQSQLGFLRTRVQELEAENAKLLSQRANCCCNEKPGRGNDKTPGKKMEKISGNCRIESHFRKRYVAIKVMYFGKRFYGFASEAHMDPTVEVISLFLRSSHKGSGITKESSEQILEDQLEGEIDYVRVLNRVLPNDIRILGWSPVPVEFHARFSCLSRKYKYFFWRENLDIMAMESAGKKFIGEHDFRNFCKMDAVNVHNYKRHVTSFEICPTDVRYSANQLWTIIIRGSAFLWHQVRCMVSVLFMIGQGLETPEVIDTLLDTDKTPRKPQYTMAPEIPLVLQSCEFEGVKFLCSSDAGEALRTHLANECKMYQLQASVFHEALLSCLPTYYDQTSPSNGITKKKASHVPLMFRPTEPSYEERRAKFNPTL